MKYQIYKIFTSENCYRIVKETILESDSSDYSELLKLASKITKSKKSELKIVKIRSLKCYHTDENNVVCNYEWEYKGFRGYSATCPNCFKQVMFKKGESG